MGDPEVECVCQWKEWTDWRAFFSFQVTLKMDPCLTGYFKKFFPWPAWLSVVQRILRRLGVNAGPYIALEAGFGWALSARRSSPDNALGASVTVSFFVGVRLGVEVSGGTGFYADASGSCRISAPFVLDSPKLVTPVFLRAGALNAGPIKAVAVIAVAAGNWIVDLGARALAFNKGRFMRGGVGDNWMAPFSPGQEIWHASAEGEWGPWPILQERTFKLIGD